MPIVVRRASSKEGVMSGMVSGEIERERAIQNQRPLEQGLHISRGSLNYKTIRNYQSLRESQNNSSQNFTTQNSNRQVSGQ